MLTHELTPIKSDHLSQSWPFLKRPYNTLPAEEILTHFQTRTIIEYFPVLDEEQAARDKVDDILDHRFDFNDELYHLPDNFDWMTNPNSDKEWLILLHKFYYAVGLGAYFHETGNPAYVSTWLHLTEAWIDTVPLDFLSSDVTGRRVQNWIFAHYYFVSIDGAPNISATFYMKFLESLHAQVCYLRENLTPSRNHRTIELYAIFLAAVVFPEFKDADAWLAFSKEELRQNLLSDILADGVHCELSTDYHHLVLKNYLNIRRLAAMNQIIMPAEMDARLQKALDFALYCHKPDGAIPSLSDGDSRSFLHLLQQGYDLFGGEARLYVASQGQAGTPPVDRSMGFPEGGYYILRSGWDNGREPYADERYLIFDCGPLGRGNHGHLDLLNFEMAAYGQSLIVDPGRYTYDESGDTNWRVQFRGTSYHNTVQVDGQEQTRYIFHKTRFKIRGPEPDWELKEFTTTDGYDFLHGVVRSHEYNAVHERKIFFVWPDYWIISDHLFADEAHDYDLRFHLSDRAFGETSLLTKDKTVVIEAPHLVIAQPLDAQVTPYSESGYVSRAYGIKHEAPVVRFAHRAANASFHTVLYPYKAEKPVISIKGIHVPGEDQASALEITVNVGGQVYTDHYFTADSAMKQTHLFADIIYDGSLLYVRRDEAGNIVNIQRQPDTKLMVDGHSIQRV